MLRRLRSTPAWLPGTLIVFFFIWLTLQIGEFILVHSNTYDELTYIGSGVSYVRTGKLDMDITEHPPLLKYAIGLSLNSVARHFPMDSPAHQQGSYAFGRDFLYRNQQSPESILARARLPTMILSLLLAAFICVWAHRAYGEWGAVLAVAAYAFEPNIIANSGLATFDLGSSCFLFIAMFFLILWKEQKRTWQLVSSGLVAGVAIASNTQGLIFFPFALVILAYDKKLKTDIGILKQDFLCILLLCVCSFAVIALAYQVRYLPAFLELFRYRFSQTFVSQAQDFSPYLHGKFRAGGWPYYFLVAFLIKSSIPFLILSGWAAISGKLQQRKVDLLLPVAIYFGVSAFAGKQQGLRYILPIYPFLCVLIGGLAQTVKKGAKLAMLITLVVWSAGECLMIRPHYMAYFNELVGGPKNGYLWLVDSNLDWGQDFGKLHAYLRSLGYPSVILASDNNADRDYYVGKRQDLLADPMFEKLCFWQINPPNPSSELLIVSAGLLAGYRISDPTIFFWLRKKTPIAQIGYTTFVYDITRDAESHYCIGIIYARTKRYDFARREFRMAAKLAPENPLPKRALLQLSAY